MITPEKLNEMLNPAKVVEAWTSAKAFDVSAQSKLFQGAADQAFSLAGLYQAQTRKAVEFWLDQADAALKQGQELVKQWAAEATKTGSRLASELEANVKEVSKVLELPKPAKTTKAA